MSRSTPRDRILARVRAATEGRVPPAHPGPFEGARPEPRGDALATFLRTFEAAGGEVVTVRGPTDAADWVRDFVREVPAVSVGAGVPDALVPAGPHALPEEAPVGISLARGAVAETGSLLLGAEDGRRTQLLPPTHVVIVDTGTVHPTLRDALEAEGGRLPSALGLHSGPSKSADIGQILVKGVHGPGRVVAVLIAPEQGEPPAHESRTGERPANVAAPHESAARTGEST